MHIEIQHDFDEVSLIGKLWLHAYGTAHITYGCSTKEWEVTAIQIRQGATSESLPAAYLSPLEGDEAAIYRMIVTALREHHSESIEDDITAALSYEDAYQREDAADYRRDAVACEEYRRAG